MYTFLSMACIG
ncbi:hypothetical protein F383_00160 [Gossypium arboreum]|uniref:Uncharacterized protein n=1 Tax=Gossypium arboreum TaxID=29729 RepID=A0A0B0PMZ0_GOSAR|nr:hypothetical protein F383_00160 [Gossypium arboreum]